MPDSLKLLLLAASCGLAGVGVAPALAQTAEAAGAHAQPEHLSGLAEIVVTAQRRAENLQDVPISITFADANQLAEARVENLTNLQAISSSIRFFAGLAAASTSNVAIRGLGTTGTSRTFEGSVGIFVDGVYRSRPGSVVNTMLDIDNVQLLRGPQGTLFGKNTTAGAILLTTTAPDTAAPSGMIDLGYGNYNSVLARAAVNMPLGDRAAVRVAALVSHNDGYFRNTLNGQRVNDDTTTAVKGQLLFTPGDDVTVRLIGDYLQSKGNCCYAMSMYKVGPTTPLTDGLARAHGPVTLPPRDRMTFLTALNGDGQQVTRDYGGALLVDIGIGAGNLKSITAYRHYSMMPNLMDGDVSPADIFIYTDGMRTRFFSQELTYNSRLEPLGADLVIGAFFADENLRMPRQTFWGQDAQGFWDGNLAAAGFAPGDVYAGPGMAYSEDMRSKDTSYAAYAHLDVPVGDRVNIIAGVRYSQEKKTGSFRYLYYNPNPQEVLRVLGLRPGPAYEATSTDKAVSGTFGIQFRPADNAMLYATYNRGFKAGGVVIDANGAGTRANNPAETPGATTLDPRYRPEKINAFEIGGKFTYLDQRARTNVSAFYYDIKDLQVTQFVGTQFSVLSVSSAKDYGFEIENMFNVLPGVNVELNGTWIPHAEYGRDPVLSPILAGQRFRYAPKFQGNAILSIDTPINNQVNFTGRAQYQYSGSQYANTGTDTEVADYGLVHLNFGIRFPDAGVAVEGWVQNLTDRRYVMQLGTPGYQAGTETAVLGAPRTFGVRLRASF